MSLILFPFFIYTAGKDNLRNLGTKKHSPAKIEVMPILRLIPNRLGVSESLLSQLSTKKILSASSLQVIAVYYTQYGSVCQLFRMPQTDSPVHNKCGYPIIP
nr:hypothetical protein [Eubacteriales bacterium]